MNEQNENIKHEVLELIKKVKQGSSPLLSSVPTEELNKALNVIEEYAEEFGLKDEKK